MRKINVRELLSSPSYWIGFFAGIPAFIIGVFILFNQWSKKIMEKDNTPITNPIPDTKPREK